MSEKLNKVGRIIEQATVRLPGIIIMFEGAMIAYNAFSTVTKGAEFMGLMGPAEIDVMTGVVIGLLGSMFAILGLYHINNPRTLLRVAGGRTPFDRRMQSAPSLTELLHNRLGK